MLTVLQVWPSVEGHQKGSYIGEVITLSITISCVPLEAVCKYLLSSFKLSLWFICSDFFLIAAPNPAANMLLVHLGFGICQLANTTNYLLSICFKL